MLGVKVGAIAKLSTSVSENETAIRFIRKEH